MTWCTYLQSFEKIQQFVFLSYSVKTKRDRRTDRQTDGRGALQYLPSRAFGAAGDNKRCYLSTIFLHVYSYTVNYYHQFVNEVKTQT